MKNIIENNTCKAAIIPLVYKKMNYIASLIVRSLTSLQF